MSHGGASHRIALAALLAATMLAGSGCDSSEARKERAIHRGEALMAEREYAKARVELRNALQADPTDANARTRLAESAEALGDYEEAVNNYRAAIELDPDQLRARARLGRMMVFGGAPEQALELVAPGLDRNPKSADLLAVRGAARAQQRDFAAARADAEAALAAQPYHSDATALLATLLWREDRREETLALLARTLEASPDDVVLRQMYARLLLAAEEPALAEEQLRELLRLEPENFGNRYRLAQLYASQMKNDLAVATLRDAVKAKPDDVEAKLALADMLAGQGQYETAEKELLGFVAAAPKNLDLRLGLARFYEANGRLEVAERVYSEVADEAGDRAAGITASTRIASLMVRSGRQAEGAKLLEEVLARNPSDANALVMRAQLALQHGDSASAIGDLRAALRDQPSNLLLIVQLAQAYIRSGNLGLAEQTLRQAVQASPRDVQARLALAQFLVNKGEGDRARPVLEQLVADAPNNFEAVAAMARLQLILGEPAAALQTASALQVLQPRSAQGYYLAGVAQQQQARTAEARRSFEQALDADPAYIDAQVALARLDVADGDAAKALQRVEARLAARPDDAALLDLRGDLLMNVDRPADAVQSYAAATRAQPAWSQPYRGQAAALLEVGDGKGAVAVLESGLEATGASGDLASDLGLLYANEGRSDEAIALFEQLLRRDPGNALAANNLAMLLVTARSDEQSLARAAELARPFAQSDNPAFRGTWGWVQYKRGRYDEAVEALEAASAKAPQSQELRYHLGMAQLAAGRKADARRHLRSAVEGNPSYLGVEQARAALQSLSP